MRRSFLVLAIALVPAANVVGCARAAERDRDTATPAAAAVTDSAGGETQTGADQPAVPAAAAGETTAARTVGTGPRLRPSEVPAISSVTLERTACFGRCPVYRVAIHRSGRVEFEGLANVRQEGLASAQIEPSAFARLENALFAAKLGSMDASYRSGDASCGMYATDMPTVTMTVTTNGRTHTIRQDYGCTGAPRELRALHRLIDSVAGTSRWTGASP